MPPKISIIVPVYKAEKYLPVCLDSILAQSFTDFELILVDDGSPDKSGAICDEYARSDSRIRVIHQKNGGASSARNKGLEAANGKYIGWVDADDRISPDLFSKLINLAESYNADIADCQYYEINGNRQIRSGRDESIVSGQDDLIMHQFFTSQMKPSLCTKIYRKELWNNIRFPIGRIHQDFYVNMRLALLPLKYVRSSEALYYYMVRENSITTTSTGREIREAIYLYDYTIQLVVEYKKDHQATKYLKADGIRRMLTRYFGVVVNAPKLKLKVYNKIIKRRLGFSLYSFLLFSDIPLKTKVSLTLLLFNLRELQISLHNRLGVKEHGLQHHD